LAATLNLKKPWLSTIHHAQDRLYVAIFVSLIIHATILLGVNFKMPVPDFDKIATSLDVVLVNNKTLTQPTDTNILAQDNLDGGGNTDEDRRAMTPFPVLPKSKPSIDNLSAQEKVAALEREAKRLLTASESTQQVDQADNLKEQPEKKPITSNTSDLVQRSLDIARLKAQISKDHSAYQKRPKRRFVGARTKEYRFARYVEDWRLKVERIGNLNYPEEARRGKLYGNLHIQ
jgi:protein TonB